MTSLHLVTFLFCHDPDQVTLQELALVLVQFGSYKNQKKPGLASRLYHTQSQSIWKKTLML